MSNIGNRLKLVMDTLNSEKIAEVGYQTFVKSTPRRSGNAKRKTTRQGKTINADYPYAKVLDDGRGFRDGQMRGSTQAPDGMTTPTIEAIRLFVFNKTGTKI